MVKIFIYSALILFAASSSHAEELFPEVNKCYNIFFQQTRPETNMPNLIKVLKRGQDQWFFVEYITLQSVSEAQQGNVDKGKSARDGYKRIKMSMWLNFATLAGAAEVAPAAME